MCVSVHKCPHARTHTHTPTHTQTHTHIPKHHIWANNPTLLTQCMLHTSVWLFNILILLFILLFIYTHKPIQSVCQLIYHHLVLFTTTVLLLYNYSTLTPPASTKGSCDSLVVTVCMHVQVCLCVCVHSCCMRQILTICICKERVSIGPVRVRHSKYSLLLLSSLLLSLSLAPPKIISCRSSKQPCGSWCR